MISVTGGVIPDIPVTGTTLRPLIACFTPAAGVKLRSRLTSPTKSSAPLCNKPELNMLQELDNITLVHLPPYSPELNLQEQVWRQMKERYLANRCFDNYDDIVDPACEAWNNSN